MIEMRDVHKIYQSDATEYHALKGLSFKINQGEMVAIIGSSGSGKTTTMNIIGLLDTPTTGEYWLNGKNVAELSNDAMAEFRNQSIGFIFQSFFLLPRLTALDNVLLPLMYRNAVMPNAQEHALAMLEKVGMREFAKHKPYELSGGQQQRVAIARALIGEPDVILADEPTGALDSTTSQTVMNILLNLNREEQKTIIIVTHAAEVAAQCQRVITIADGKIKSE